MSAHLVLQDLLHQRQIFLLQGDSPGMSAGQVPLAHQGGQVMLCSDVESVQGIHTPLLRRHSTGGPGAICPLWLRPHLRADLRCDLLHDPGQKNTLFILRHSFDIQLSTFFRHLCTLPWLPWEPVFRCLAGNILSPEAPLPPPL